MIFKLSIRLGKKPVFFQKNKIWTPENNSNFSISNILNPKFDSNFNVFQGRAGKSVICLVDFETKMCEMEKLELFSGVETLFFWKNTGFLPNLILGLKIIGKLERRFSFQEKCYVSEPITARSFPLWEMRPLNGLLN